VRRASFDRVRHDSHWRTRAPPHRDCSKPIQLLSDHRSGSVLHLDSFIAGTESYSPSGFCIEFAELGTFNPDWDIPTHHVAELIVTLACIEWSSMNRESGLFILTLMTGFDRCAYFYFFLAKLRYLREKYGCCSPRESGCQSAPDSAHPLPSSEPIDGTGVEVQPTNTDLLFDLSPSALRLMAGITLVYYTLFVRGSTFALLITHIILKRDTMPLGWQIALLPAFLVFISVDLPTIAVMWKRSLKVREQRHAASNDP
jgi:hypothetical protein